MSLGVILLIVYVLVMAMLLGLVFVLRDRGYISLYNEGTATIAAVFWPITIAVAVPIYFLFYGFALLFDKIIPYKKDEDEQE